MSTPVISLLAAGIPQELRDLKQWVAWRLEDRTDAKGKTRATKVPYDAKTGKRADSTNPSTWASFDDAVSSTDRFDTVSGIGFVFASGGGLVGVDLDKCRDPATGVIADWALKHVEAFSTYTEISQSGTGLHLICRAPALTSGRRKGPLEIYSDARYFVMTGHKLNVAPPTVKDCSSQVAAIVAEIEASDETVTDSPGAARPLVAVDATDEELLERAFRSKNGGEIRGLFADGRWRGGEDRSGADLALCNYLAFWTGRDAARMDRIFRGSALYRDKWDEKRRDSTYGADTIELAIKACRETYNPRRNLPVETTGSGTVTDAGGSQEKTVEGPTSLGERDANGRLVLSPTKTLPTAKSFVAELYHHPHGRKLHSYAGDFMAWRGNRFVAVEEEALCQQLQPWLHDAYRYQLNKKTGSAELVGFDSNPRTFGSALESVRAYVHLSATVTPPVWLDNRADSPDPRDLLPFPSGTLDLASGKILSPSPALFNVNAIDYEFDPAAASPDLWLNFVDELWGDDVESIQLLQEWMGYSLVADTSQHKMLLIVGPTRSGKGTVGRVLTRLVGAGNVVGPTTSSLAGSFGLQQLIGKSLAIVSDARFSGDNVGVIVERLLCISGEDTLTVDRKFLSSVTMKLPTRFVFLTNELPRLNESSGALAKRFVMLRLTKDFYGRENHALTRQIYGELPGILLWAIQGLKRLRERGHFVQPESVSETVQQLEDLASPVLAFVRDRCEVGVGHRAWIESMYGAWEEWCKADGRNNVSTKQTFGRDLAAAVAGVVCRRNSAVGRFYDGISLKGASAP